MFCVKGSVVHRADLVCRALMPCATTKDSTRCQPPPKLHPLTSATSPWPVAHPLQKETQALPQNSCNGFAGQLKVHSPMNERSQWFSQHRFLTGHTQMPLAAVPFGIPLLLAIGHMRVPQAYLHICTCGNGLIACCKVRKQHHTLHRCCRFAPGNMIGTPQKQSPQLRLQFRKVERPDEDEHVDLLLATPALHARTSPNFVQAVAALAAYCQLVLRPGTASGQSGRLNTCMPQT